MYRENRKSKDWQSQIFYEIFVKLLKSEDEVREALYQEKKDYAYDKTKNTVKNDTIDIIKAMLIDKMDINIISKHTGLTIEEIKKIKRLILCLLFICYFKKDEGIVFFKKFQCKVSE